MKVWVIFPHWGIGDESGQPEGVYSTHALALAAQKRHHGHTELVELVLDAEIATGAPIARLLEVK